MFFMEREKEVEQNLRLEASSLRTEAATPTTTTTRSSIMEIKKTTHFFAEEEGEEAIAISSSLKNPSISLSKRFFAPFLSLYS